MVPVDKDGCTTRGISSRTVDLDQRATNLYNLAILAIIVLSNEGRHAQTHLSEQPRTVG